MERLSRQNIRCATVELPFTSLSDDVETLRKKIAQLQDGGVTVVSHSYSGITASIAAHDAHHLVYIAARLPALGESQTELSPNWGNPNFRNCLKFSGDGEQSLTDNASEYLFHRSPAALAEYAMQNRRTMRSEIPADPLENPAWLSVPSSYVVCTDDRAVLPDQQRIRASWVKHSVELATDHSPFFSMPDQTADFIFETHVAEVDR